HFTNFDWVLHSFHLVGTMGQPGHFGDAIQSGLAQSLSGDIKNLSAQQDLTASRQGHHPGGNINVHSEQFDLVTMRLAINLPLVNTDSVQNRTIVRSRKRPQSSLQRKSKLNGSVWLSEKEQKGIAGCFHLLALREVGKGIPDQRVMRLQQL